MSIFWRIHTKGILNEQEGPLVEFQWGWTAGMSKKELKEWADDAPKGHQTLITNLELAELLHHDLGESIRKIKQRAKLKRRVVRGGK